MTSRPCPDVGEQPFTITCERLDEGIMVAVTGEIDLATAPPLEEELRRAEESHDLIMLNLCGVSFMDSAGLHAALEAERRSRQRGTRLVVASGNGPVRRILELAEAADGLEMVEHPDELRQSHLRQTPTPHVLASSAS